MIDLRPMNLSLPFASLFCATLLLSCQNQESTPSSAKVQALTETEHRVLNFELVSDWSVWSGSGQIQNSPNRSEGAFSIAVSGIGYAGLRNVVPITKDEHPAPAVVGYDVWVPANQVNQWWHGDTQLYIDAPSAGISGQYLGYRSFNDMPKGQFNRVDFPLPDWIREALDQTEYDDLRITVAINAEPGSATHYVDRFILGPDPGGQTCTPVDDGNPCTADDCDPTTGQTMHVPLAPGALCSDGNDCNGIEACDGAGLCEPQAPDFDDENPCTIDTCDAATGIAHTPAPAGTSCSDDDACNGAELCGASGACQAGTPAVVDDGNPCTIDSCDPIEGISHVPAAEGTSCSDANVCNGEELCDAGGACANGSPLAVDDENPCTIDACDTATGVTYTPLEEGTSCDEDGDVCNGENLCNSAGACVVGIPPIVDDNNPCTSDSCDVVAGVIHASVAAGASCTDGNACNGAETCNGVGVCSMGIPPEVDDQNPCTADACDPLTGVSHFPVSAGVSCNDGNACSGEEVCNGAGVCGSGSPPEVDDGNPCTADACDAVLGVTHTPVDAGTSCDDGNLCNGQSACDAGGACVSGQTPTLDDGNPCTDDACDASAGVTHTPVSAGTSCSDGNACNGEEVCDIAGSCQNGGGPVVDDGNPCTIDSCDDEGGVVHVPAPAGTSCGDANACNGAEICDGSGACDAGAPLVVPAPEDCRVYSCDPVQGIVSSSAAVGTSCADGNLCNGAEVCGIGGVCNAGTPIVPEDDGNSCTVDSCDPSQGTVHTPVVAGTSCGDGDACNGSELCDGAGACAPGAPVIVDDGNACTIGECDSATGTVTQTPAPVDSPCGDGNLCNGYELCDGSGTCEAGAPLNVDDGNVCTVDSCDPLFGVDNSPAASGLSCADGDVCNGDETCNGFGACGAGTPLNIDDGLECTVDSCDPTIGVTHEEQSLGTQCGDEGHCIGGGICSEGCDPDGPAIQCAVNEACSPTGVCEPYAVSVVAPPLDSTTTVSVEQSLRFLYEGEDAIQLGVQPGTVEEKRIVGLSGYVTDVEGLPLEGVLVEVIGHPEYGYTYSRSEGRYDMALNGGGWVRVSLKKPGYLKAQRRVETHWDEYVSVEKTVLKETSVKITTVVNNSASSQEVRGELSSDSRGERTNAIMFPSGTIASALLPDGTSSPLSDLSVRVTDYTVGASGPDAMPAPLPNGTKYTHAFEITVDQAEALGAEHVVLDRPVSHYVENFLGFPTGAAVPVATLDHDSGQWVPEKNGLVIEIVDVLSGAAVLDVTGEGTPATAAQLEALGIDAEELIYLAVHYSVGDSLWRTRIQRFSAVDCNYGSANPSPVPPPSNDDSDGTGNGKPGSSGSFGGDGDGDGDQVDDRGTPPCGAVGSRINVQKGNLGENIPIHGTPFELVYSSHRSGDSKSNMAFDIPVTGETLPDDLIEIIVDVTIAGELIQQRFSTLPPNTSLRFEWDRLDGFGRIINGRHRAHARVSYVVPSYYLKPAVQDAAFATNSGEFYEPLVLGPTIELMEHSTKLLGLVPSLTSGWNLSAHHVFDVASRSVHMGDGRVIPSTLDLIRKAGRFDSVVYAASA